MPLFSVEAAECGDVPKAIARSASAGLDGPTLAKPWRVGTFSVRPNFQLPGVVLEHGGCLVPLGESCERGEHRRRHATAAT